MEFHLACSIDCSPAEVFTFLSSLDQLPWEQHPVVADYQKVTPGPTGVGTLYREVVRLPLGMRMVIHSKVTRYELSRRLEYRWWAPGMRGELAYRLQPEGVGTHITQVQSLHPQGVFKLFSPLIQRVFSHRIADRLESIKAQLEGHETFTGDVIIHHRDSVE